MEDGLPFTLLSLKIKFSMEKVILFGATGNLGKEIAKELKQQGYDLTVAVRNAQKAQSLSFITSKHVIVNVSEPKDVCKGFDIVVSALGKSVSPNDKSKQSFTEIDLHANTAILEDAKKNGVKKFVYVSALHSENYLHLEYFKVHHEFSERLKKSGLNYSIIKPPAIFCAFIDVIAMAKKGQLMNIGTGDKKTNPIYEGDLALVCVNSIRNNNVTIEAGGAEIFTRKQMNEIIQSHAAPGKKLRSVPASIVKLALPLMKLFDRNAHAKFAFFTEVTQHDTLAPQLGKMKFEEYVRMKSV
jgi:uncharacterized protein YbjT (DUF2867 family)